MVHPLILLVLFGFAWVGHACIWTSLLNYVYARPYPKGMLRVWRQVTGVIILAFPFLAVESNFEAPAQSPIGLLVYLAPCLFLGGVVFPIITVRRALRRPPTCLVQETSTTLDLRKELGDEVIGNGKGRAVAGFTFNDVFRVDFTETVLVLPDLPEEWDGLTILHLSDVHYHGTPSRSFHERVMAEIETRWPNPDLVCLTGDFVDTDEHHEWIKPLLGRFRGREGNFAILGNHDQLHHPDVVRASLAAAGYTVIGNAWKETVIRGVRCVVVGHEGPWFKPEPDLTNAPTDCFRVCLSHSPDQFYWGIRHGIGLMLCGHVHGGQIRVPVIGSIFVPSVYGRRFDMGVFERAGTAMVVSRGLSGKEPLRFRCHPQVMRITLRKP